MPKRGWGRRLLYILVPLTCGLALLGAAYQYRVSLISTLADTFVDSNTAVLADLQGVEVGTGSASIALLEFVLPASGLHVAVHDARFGYSLGDLLLARTVQSIAIGKIELRRVAELAEVPESAGPETLLSDVLLLLGDFPIGSLEVDDIRIPDREEALVVSLQHQHELFTVNVTSGTLRLRATVDQQHATNAKVQLQLSSDAITVADFTLALQPEGSGYTVAGTGDADIPDFGALLGEPLLELLGLPLAALQVEFALEADIADALLSAPPALLNIQLQDDPTLMLRDEIIEGLAGVTLRVEEAVQLTLGAGNAAASGRMPLAVTGSWQQQPFEVALVLDAVNCQLQAGEACAIDFDAKLLLAALTMAAEAPADATRVDALEFAGGGTMALQADAMLITFDTGAHFVSGTVNGPSVQVGSVALTTAAPLLIGRTLGAAGLLTLEGEHVRGTLTELVASGYTLDSEFSLHDLRLAVSSAIAGEAVLRTHGLRVKGDSWLPAVDIDAHLQLEADMLRFATTLLLPSAPGDAGLAVQGTYGLDSGAAMGTLTLPALTFDGPGASLSAYLGGWPFPFDVMTGTLAADLAFQWNPAEIAAPPAEAGALARSGILSASFNAGLSDAAGFYNEMFFAGLDTRLQTTIDTSAQLPLSTPPLSLTIATLDVGVPLTDISVNYQVDAATQTVHVAAFEAALLGGTLGGVNVSYDLNSERNLLNLRFSGLRLDYLAALVEYDGIALSGAVSGLLPLVITPNGVEVADGRLSADAPGGSIRYLDGPTAGSGGNLGVDLVNQALGNYQFDSLESSIDYSPDGELLLGMKLQGRNPDMNSGQLINLNLNLSNNIPDLLDSLQAGRAIEEFLESQYGPGP